MLLALIIALWQLFHRRRWIALKAKEDSLEYAIARDQLIRRGVLPDDEIATADNQYWNQF
jgi:hypothetical protein